MQQPVVRRKAALELACDDATAFVEGAQNADDKFGALRIVQSETRGNEQVVLERIGCPAATPIVSPFGKQDQVRVRTQYGIERVLATQDKSCVVLFL